MNEIPPSLAADLASDIYDLVKKEAPIELTLRSFQSTYSTVLDLNVSNLAHARTGGPGFIKCETVFGMMVYGSGPAYGKHAFVVLRGTKILGDMLTNLNATNSRSTAGHLVHDGFNQTFRSLRSELDRFVAGLSQRGINTVHCIGHSLGGALATLCAEYLKSVTSKEVYLYSFGSPRVGLSTFADQLSKKLTPERVFRVYHRTDIVPCVPTWPYAHVPSVMADMYDYFQPSPGSVPQIAWHGMDSYLQTVGNNNWTQLRGKRFEPFNSNAIEKWLNVTSPIYFNVTDLARLDKAIWYVLKKCVGFLGLSLAFFSNKATNFSIYDTMAYVLQKALKLANSAAQTAVRVPSLIMALLNKIAGLLGLRPVDETQTTRYSIRNLFQQLTARLNEYCRNTLDAALKLEVA